MVILAILSVLAYGGLNAVMRAQDHSVKAANELKNLQLAMRYMERDFRQLSTRPTRDQFGDLQPSLYTTNTPLLTLTKSGWHNPGGLTHSQMQRVSYDIVDQVLVRQVWQALDGGDEEDVLETTLLENVDKLEFRFQNEQGDWEEDWPPAGQSVPSAGQVAPPNGQAASASVTGGSPIPRMLEFTITAEPWGKIQRLISFQ